jgi:hypothetical protein
MHRNYDSRKHLGPKNVNWKGGASMQSRKPSERKKLKYIHVVPEHMRDILTKLSENPELLHSSDEIVLLDARIHDLLSKLEHGASSEIIKESKDLLDQVFEAFRAEDGDRVSTSLNRLRSVLHSGDEESDEIWKSIHETMEQRRKLVDTERRVMDSEEMSLRADKLLIVASEIGRVARLYIPKEKHDAFMKEFRSIFLPESDPITKVIDLK